MHGPMIEQAHHDHICVHGVARVVRQPRARIDECLGLAGAAVPDGRRMAGLDSRARERCAHFAQSEETHCVPCGCHATIVEVTRRIRQVPTKKCDTYLLETTGRELQGEIQ